MFLKLLQPINVVISEYGTATGSGPHRMHLQKEKDRDSGLAKMLKKKLPRKDQLDLQGFYSDIFSFFFFFKLPLTLHGSVQNKEKQCIWFSFPGCEMLQQTKLPMNLIRRLKNRPY